MLIVDNFGVSCVGEEHTLHIKETLERHYSVTNDWVSTGYIGITLNWVYNCQQVHLSMPGYVKKTLKQFQHQKPTKKQHAPFPCARINCGTKNNTPRNNHKHHCWTRNATNIYIKYAASSYFFGQISRFYTVMSHQCHCIPISITDRGYIETNTSCHQQPKQNW